ncbi:MAG: universal stress protein [Halanaeroarchaeum sp.]
MGLYRRILVPTDGSGETRRAIDHAVDLAAVHDATVHGLYVLNTASYASVSVDASWDGVSEMLREEGERAIETVTEAAEDAEVAVETALRSGSPSREIVRYAEEEACDLIVMGTHGRGGIDRLLLGSVAERVVRSSTVPVLTIRVGADEQRVEARDSAEADAELSEES